MSVSGIFSSSFNNNQVNSSFAPTQFTNTQFQQLGQDLASGNLSAAQSDFATLRQAFAQPAAVSSASTSNPITQAFQQLSADLKSGNLSAAQKDYSNIQQDLQSSSRHLQNHHLFRIGPEQPFEPQNANLGGTAPASTGSQPASTSDAQQAYASLQQELEQFTIGNGTDALSASLTSSPLSFLA